MRVAIITQSEEFANSAGMRIRYNRFIKNAQASAHEVVVQTLSDLAANYDDADSDVYIFCKTFEPDAIVIAHRLKQDGKIVGQDLFDDYFSQRGDGRLLRFRDWLAQMAGPTDFALCSTERMRQVVSRYYPTTPVSTIDDPAPPYAIDEIVALATRKMEQAASGTCQLVWFGIGDNPFFSVGIDDLSAMAGHVRQMSMAGLKVELTLVSNDRAFDADGLAMLRRTIGKFRFVSWTKAAEDEALRDATVALLPVNAQAFSAAKSLNRAITALCHGCQVLSLGYPLYEPLADLIYRNAAELAADLKARRARLGAHSAATIAQLLEQHASPARAASRLMDAVTDAASARNAAEKRPILLINGRRSTIAAHKLVGKLGGISVRSPYSKEKWNFPLRFDIVGGRLEVRATMKLLAGPLSNVPRRGQPMKINEFEFDAIDLSAMGLPDCPAHSDIADIVRGLIPYQRVTDYIARACALLFPRSPLVFADSASAHLSPPRSR